MECGSCYVMNYPKDKFDAPGDRRVANALKMVSYVRIGLGKIYFYCLTCLT